MTAGGSEAFRHLGFAVLPGATGESGGSGESRVDSEASSLPHPAGALAQADFEIPAGSSLFDGHFPGKPILPGIAHLALAQRALIDLAAWRIAAEARGARESSAFIPAAGLAPAGGRARAPGTEIVAVRNLRLRLPVNPGDHLALRLTAIGGGLRFDLRRGVERVSQGEVCTAGSDESWSSPPQAPGLDAAIPSAAIQPETTGEAGQGGPEHDFPPPAALLPHAPPARLLRAVLAAGAGGIVCTAVVPPSHPLAVKAKAPGFLALEIAAQAAACLESLRRPRSGTPPIGYLVGVRHAHLAPTLPCDALLQVRAHPAGNAAALTVYNFELHLAADHPDAARKPGEPLAKGTLSTYLPIG